MSDRYGRRPIIFLSVVSSTVPLVVLLSGNFVVYFVAFGVMGLLGGDSSGSIPAFVNDLSHIDDRSRRFGVLGAVTAFGAVSPTVGGWFEAWFGTEGLLWSAVAAGVLSVVLTLFLRESLPADRRSQVPVDTCFDRMVEPVGEFVKRADLRLWLLVLVKLIKCCVVEGQWTVTFFAFLRMIPGWIDQDTATFLTLGACCRTVAQGVALPLLLSLGFGDSSLALLAQGMQVVMYIIFVSLEIFPAKALLFASVVMGNCLDFFDPVFTKLVTTGYEEEEVGLLLGVLSSMSVATSIVTPTVFSTVYRWGTVYPFALQLACAVVAFAGIMAVGRVSPPSGTKASDATNSDWAVEA
jgi:DHA1 family tetracycline resistance protein-like MFS transporter